MRLGSKFDDIQYLYKVIRELREQLYFKTCHTYAQERDWESEAEEEQREAHNADKRAAWDKETERIIRKSQMDEEER